MWPKFPFALCLISIDPASRSVAEIGGLIDLIQPIDLMMTPATTGHGTRTLTVPGRLPDGAIMAT